MKKEMNNNKGFSLVELIVVIAIMAVLMAVLAPTMLRYIEKTRVQKDNSAVAEVIQAVNNALADETVNKNTKANDTVTVSNGTIGGTATDLITEVKTTIDPNDISIDSNAHKSQTYTITIKTGADGSSLQATAFDESNWK